ncbi:agmatine deiminase family protein, partial [Candidatus Woesearchaeota archaeon]|nr:agmatine deiminase family protein [Candidatus Woesearchaeota archaeon]
LSLPFFHWGEDNRDLLFRDYPFATSLHLQSSYRGKIVALFTCKYNPLDTIEEFRQVAAFFDCPLTVFTDENIPKEGLQHSLVKAVHLGHQYSGWQRDMFLAAAEGIVTNGVPFSSRIKSRRQSAQYSRQVRPTLEAVLQQTGKKGISAPFVFEGGQILKTDYHTLLPDFFDDQGIFIKGYEGLPQETFEALLGKVLFVPTTVNGMPFAQGHIDEFVTVLDKDTLAVGDVDLAQAIIRDMDDATIAAYNEMLRSYILDHYQKFRMPKPIIQGLGRSDTPITERARRAGASMAAFLSQHYNIERVPLLILHILSGQPAEEAALLSYNNVLQDRDHAKVVLPRYQIREIDAEAEKIFRKHGYSNILCLDSRDTVFTRASFHCNYFEVRAA